ncbi:hypothetical protein CO046_01225 [Candidatus Peregrinibacteria bacterium CG_4_9_14_0_2_um_filter_53_11]|nr:MAG: hypothetical protein CO046_01225 [Candidatus Peregrinibacteria bacterium CG_4_9_14_0_2_um_filter_53_11]
MSLPDHYNDFISKNPSGTIFQAGVFAEFQRTIPYRGEAFELLSSECGPRTCGPHRGVATGGVRAKGEPAAEGELGSEGLQGSASCLAIVMKLPYGLCWLWVPYGPLGGYNEALFSQLEAVVREKRAIFTRIEPPASWSPADAAALEGRFSLAPASHRLTAGESLILDLTLSEAALLEQMKPKGRYNIRLAQRKGVTVKRYTSVDQLAPGEFEAFYQVLQQTGSRDGFGIHPASYYEQLLKNLGPSSNAALYLAYDEAGTVIAGIITTYFGSTATYYYGASSPAHRPLMAPYLLQWEAILDAKNRGFHSYDFLGIAPPNSPDHPWAGITDFKKKFGGTEIHYPEAVELVHRPLLYKLYRLKNRLRP